MNYLRLILIIFLLGPSVSKAEVPCNEITMQTDIDFALAKDVAVQTCVRDRVTQDLKSVIYGLEYCNRNMNFPNFYQCKFEDKVCPYIQGKYPSWSPCK
jgi:hypothetical protein